MPIVDIPGSLREKLGEKGVEDLIKLLNEIEESTRERSIEVVESKFERRLIEETSKLRSELKEEIAEVRTEIANTRANLIKWMFIFWVGQIGVLTGILFAFFRK